MKIIVEEEYRPSTGMIMYCVYRKSWWYKQLLCCTYSKTALQEYFRKTGKFESREWSKEELENFKGNVDV